MKRTIAVDLTPVLPGGDNGGAKIFVLELLRTLAAMRPDHEFVLLTQAASHDELAHLDRPNMRRHLAVGTAVGEAVRPRLHRLGARVFAHMPVRLRRVAFGVAYRVDRAMKRGGARGLLRELDADLLFCPFTAPTYAEAGVPAVCTIYDLQYRAYPEFFSAEDAAHRDRTFRDACRMAAALAAISDHSRESAIVHGALDPARIRTIHLRLASRMAPAATGETDALAKLGILPGRYLLYPANFWRHKNHEMLLTAFGLARSRGLPEDYVLVCTGAPGERRDWLAAAAAAMGLGERVRFPGFLPEAALAEVMGQAGAVVFPSLYEGFGLPLLEAMAAGVPVACSDATSLPEVAAGAALLFDPRVPETIADALVAIAGDSAMRARLVQAGRERAESFSDTGRMAREYAELFDFAIGRTVEANAVSGAYADGWIGPRLAIQVAPARDPLTLELEVEAPGWIPQGRTTVCLRHRSGREEVIKLAPGATKSWSIPLGPEGGWFEMSLEPTFVPARTGHGPDARELSLLLRRCRVVGPTCDVDLLAPVAA